MCTGVGQVYYPKAEHGGAGEEGDLHHETCAPSLRGAAEGGARFIVKDFPGVRTHHGGRAVRQDCRETGNKHSTQV